MTLGKLVHSAIIERDDGKFAGLLDGIGDEIDRLVDSKIAERRIELERIGVEKAAALMDQIRRDNEKQGVR